MFYFSSSHEGIAHQVAGLINDHNDLSKKRLAPDILRGKTNYVVETHGNLVLGAVGIDRQSYTFTELKHLVIRKEWRNKGIARLLVKRAMAISDTRMLYCTARSDNVPSLSLFEKLGFVFAEEYLAENHKVKILVRVTPQWEKIKPELKLSWLDAQVPPQNLVQMHTKQRP